MRDQLEIIITVCVRLSGTLDDRRKDELLSSASSNDVLRANQARNHQKKLVSHSYISLQS